MATSKSKSKSKPPTPVGKPAAAQPKANAPKAAAKASAPKAAAKASAPKASGAQAASAPKASASKASGAQAVASAPKASAKPTLPPITGAQISAPALPFKAGKPKASAKPAAVARTAAEVSEATGAASFHLEVRGATGTTTYADGADEIVVAPPTWFALALTSATTRRYLHLVQRSSPGGQVVLLAMIDGAGATRIPAAPGWQRAVVAGTVHALVSDLLLTRDEIVELIGGHEPPPTEARPPFT